MRNALRRAESIAPCILWIDEIEKALHALVSDDICNLPMPTPEEIQSKKELCKIILDELNKADESKKK